MPLVLAPWGATKVETAFLLSAITIGLAWFGAQKDSKLLKGLSGVEALLAIAAYLVATIQNKIPGWQLELTILVALILAGTIALHSIYKTFATKEQNLAVGGTALALLSLRLLTLGFTHTLIQLDPTSILLISLAVVATISHIAGDLTQSMTLRVLAFIGSAATLLAYGSFAIAFPPFPIGSYSLNGVLTLAHLYMVFRIYWKESYADRFSYAVAAVIPASVIVANLVYVTLTQPAIHAVPATACVWGMLVASTFLVLTGRALKIPDLNAIASISVGVTFLTYAVTRFQDPTHILWAETILILALAGIIVLVARLNWPLKPEDQAHLGGLVSIPVAALLFWNLQILLFQGWNIPIGNALTYSSFAVTLTSIFVAQRKKWPVAYVSAWGSWLLGFFALFITDSLSVVQIALVLIPQIALALAPDRDIPAPTQHRYLHLLITTYLVSRIGLILFDFNVANTSASPALTITWTILAIAFLVSGFVSRTTELRHAGLGLLIVAATKLVIIDLAETDDIVRVTVTLALGLAMIGGGYLYIRLQNQLFPATPTADPIE